MRGLQLASALVLAVACGGNVTGGGTGGSAGTSSGGTSSGGSGGTGHSGGSGGTGNAGGSSGTGNVGGSGGNPATCVSFADCCHQACAMVATAPPCPGGGATDCTCASGLPADCELRITDAYRCVLGVGPGALKCDQSGKLSLRCGVCDAEMSAAAAACGGGDFKCAY